MNKSVEFAIKSGTSISPEITQDEFFEKMEELSVKLYEEAVIEFQEALNEQSVLKLLDVLCDCKVYLAQLEHSLQVIGADTVGAIKDVEENNLTKITSSQKLGLRWLEKALYDGKPVDKLSSVHFEGEDWYCLHNFDGKVIKPYDFQSVDLTQRVAKVSFNEPGPDIDRMIYANEW